MSKEIDKKVLTTALGAVVVSTLSISVANASSSNNPFEMTELSQGYQQLAEMSCGEGKCGSDKEGEGKGSSDKEGEGKCGSDKGGEGKCGSDS